MEIVEIRAEDRWSATEALDPQTHRSEESTKDRHAFWVLCQKEFAGVGLGLLREEEDAIRKQFWSLYHKNIKELADYLTVDYLNNRTTACIQIERLLDFLCIQLKPGTQGVSVEDDHGFPYLKIQGPHSSATVHSTRKDRMYLVNQCGWEFGLERWPCSRALAEILNPKE